MKQLIIRAKGDDAAEILLYDVIGGDFFGEGVTAKTFREQLKNVKAKTINLRINSPGGSTFEASAMLAALDAHPARIEVDVDGVAASAASVVAMGGDVIRMASNSLLMIHDPHIMTAGGSDDLRRVADLLDTVREQLIGAYARHSKAGREQIAEWMKAETWFDGKAAVEAGFAHEVTGPVAVAALARGKAALAHLGYRHAPAALLKAQAENPLDLEVGDSVEWLSEDPDEMCAMLEDGVIEEISEGTLGIAGTSLTLKGSAADPAVRVVDEDEDETCWYLVRMSQLREAEGSSLEVGTPARGGMGAVASKLDQWEETKRRQEIAAKLCEG